MAVVVLTDVFILVGATNLELQLVKMEIDLSLVDLDSTAFGGSGWTSTVGGLKSAKIACDFNQDYTVTTGIDAILFPLFGTIATFEGRPTSAARGTSNPAYTGSLLIDDWKPISGKAGDLAVSSVSWPATGPVLRQTS